MIHRSFGLYRPGNSVLHRLGAGTKLALLAGVSVVTVAWRTPLSTSLLMATALVGFSVAKTPTAAVLSLLRRVAVIVVIVGGYQAWQRGLGDAYAIVGNLVGLILLAGLVNTVTPVQAIVDSVARVLGPTRRLGVRPDRIALAFALLLAALPETAIIARRTRDAARARGLERNARARLVPLVVRTTAHARAKGDALYSRAVLDDPDI